MQNAMNMILLKSLVDSMEGYPESVKFLHKNTAMEYTGANSFRYNLCTAGIPNCIGKCIDALS